MTTKEATETALAPIDTLRGMLKKHDKSISLALAKRMDASRFAQVAVTQCSKNPTLLTCAPVTLLGAIVQAAQLGLDLESLTRQAYLVPFKNNKKNRMEVQLIVGYGGMIELARRSGKITRFEARTVHEKDEFYYTFGSEADLKHTPSRERDPGPPSHFYAVATFNDGTSQFDVMTIEEVKRIRDRFSKAATSGPWVDHFEEMGKKTVVRRLCKFLPVSPEAQKAVTLDELGTAGVPQDLGILVDSAETGTVEDAEGIPEDVLPREVGEKAPAATPESAKAPTTEPVAAEDGTLTIEGAVEGHSSFKAGRGKVHKITLEGGLLFSSFDPAHGSAAVDAQTFRKRVRIVYKVVTKDDRTFNNIVSITQID